MADINWGYGGGVSAQEWDNIFERRRQRMEKRAAAPDIAPALAGDKEALGRVAAASPDIAIKLAYTINNMDQRTAAQAKTRLELAGRLAAGVLSVPPAMQPAAYAAALDQARAAGLDTSKYPQAWDPAAKAWLEHNARMLGTTSQLFKRMGAQGGGGGGAPADSGWTNPGPTPLRTSSAPAVTPTVASMPQPAAPLPGAVQPVAPTQVAGAGPMPMDLPPAPQIAPAASPPPTQIAGAQPPQTPQVVSPDQQYAQGGDGDTFVPVERLDRVSQGRFVGMPKGATIKVDAKGKIHDVGGVAMIRLANGELGGWDPKARKTFAAQDLSDRIELLDMETGQTVRTLPKGGEPQPLGQPKPADAPVDRAAAWSVYEQLPAGWQMMGDRGRPIIDKDGRYYVKRPDGQPDWFLPAKSAPTPANFEPDPDRPGSFRPQRGGPADPAQAKALADAKRLENAKTPPASVVKGMTENLASIKQVDRALSLIAKTPGSIGGWGSQISDNTPGFVGRMQNKYGDPEGTDLRAIIANIGSLIIHQRSGAAVTAAEFPRLRPFIPSISDGPEEARKKLQQFKDAYLDEMEAMADTYNLEGGFRPHAPTMKYLDEVRRKADAPPAPAGAPPPASPPGATGKAPADKPALIYDPATGGFK